MEKKRGKLNQQVQLKRTGLIFLAKPQTYFRNNLLTP